MRRTRSRTLSRNRARTRTSVLHFSCTVQARGWSAAVAGGAELARRIDAEHLDLAAEEPELLEREAHRALVGMAVGVGVELGGREMAADHVALELGQIDAVGREAAERLVER